MDDYPEDYDLDTSDGYIVEDGSTIVFFLLAFLSIFVILEILKVFGKL